MIMPYGDVIPASKPNQILSARRTKDMTVVLIYDTTKKEYRLDVRLGRMQLTFGKDELDALFEVLDYWRHEKESKTHHV